MLTKGKFLVSFEVPGHTKEYTEGFTEEMVIPYRTEELNPYLSDPQAQVTPYPTETKKQKEMNILYHIILSVGTILTLIRNEKIYQAHKHTHPTNKIRYIISQLIILTLYTSSLILVSYTLY